MTTHIPYSREKKPEGWVKPRPPGYYTRAAEAQRKRRQANPEKYREMGKVSERNRKLKKYGLTLEQYNFMLEAQNNSCAICKEDKKTIRDWHVDHCHTTGKVRGILCHHCNLLLGNARDNKNTLYNAINYLNKYD